ncbi:MAG: hypothetical protein K9N49_03305 [Candidatus Marinimicrobia bacterium]|nr:hypothetical protein [Candidatus Neomarinimicrobiota bacterium]
MGKLLKPLVVVLLLLSIGALVLGGMLYGKREVLKKRTQLLQDSADTLARNLRFEGFRRDQLQDLETLRQPLALLEVHADNQYLELQETKADLARTREELAQVKEELAQTRAELTRAQERIAALEAEIQRKDVELAQARAQIETLEREQRVLQVEVEELTARLAAAEEAAREDQDTIAALENTIAQMADALGELPQPPMPQDLKGQVLFVNPQWNFAILDIGSEDGLRVSAELLVHRGDQLVGKLRVTDVRKHMAIADLLLDWQQEPLQEGDHVFF